jgi:lysophospholipase L1-like esterase
MRNVLFGLLACGLSVAICDVGLRAASLVSPRVRYELQAPWDRNVVNDALLGRRMSPFFPGHDRRGYRNQLALDRAEVLAVGDSVTYGFAAPPDGAWPQQLARLSGKSIYNAGVGGYGPCEYEAVATQLLPDIKAKTVLLGLYLGNDIGNAYASVYVDGRFPKYRSSDQSVLAAMNAADERATMAARQQRLDPTDARQPIEPSLFEYSAVYSLLRSVRYGLQQHVDKPFRAGAEDSIEMAAKRPGRVTFNALAPVQTVFRNPELDALAVDLTDPRMQEGWRITKDVLVSMRDTLGSTNRRLVVVVLHNKPYEYSDLVRRHQPALGSAFFRLVDLEQSLTDDLTAFLRASGIEFVDTDRAVRSQLDGGSAAFPASDDHHPNSTGYAAIAGAVLPLIIE